MVLLLLLGLQGQEKAPLPEPQGCAPRGLLRGAEVKGVTKVQGGLVQAGAPGC